ncbi:MAG: glycosyltransferase family 1 protein [Bacteroidota bacterium]
MSPVAVHIVSFDIPFPANYGGVIDVYYKILALHAAGVDIHLHCYEHLRSRAPELEKYCQSVQYYRRRAGLAANFSFRPYIVAGRMSEELINNLLQDDHPVLFEGLHTCGFLGDSRLQGRFLIYRESNIEHHYYYHLFRAEKNPVRKLFFLAESARLKLFQKTLEHASVMLPVSQDDTNYLLSQFPGKRILTLPSFHSHNRVAILEGRGSYALYQGNLSVAENSLAAKFLISRVWEDSFPELVIAGLNPPAWLLKMAGRRRNIRFIVNPSDDQMFRLIRDAHVNIMVTFQPTGLKLKLLNALFNGRFCLVNPHMVAGTTLGDLCTLASGPDEFKVKVREIFLMEFDRSLVSKREVALMTTYSNQNNCKILKEILTLR